MMQNDFRSRTGFPAKFQIGDVSLAEVKSRPLRRRHPRLNCFEILLLSTGKIIETPHTLVEFEQRFEEVGADKSGDARDQPRARRGCEPAPEFIVMRCCRFRMADVHRRWLTGLHGRFPHVVAQHFQDGNAQP